MAWIGWLAILAELPACKDDEYYAYDDQCRASENEDRCENPPWEGDGYRDLENNGCQERNPEDYLEDLPPTFVC